jgi:hypothetical protein
MAGRQVFPYICTLDMNVPSVPASLEGYKVSSVHGVASRCAG